MTTAASGVDERTSPHPTATRRGAARRLFWLQQMRRWHWISSAVCLFGLVLFAGTGLTLNHAAQIEAKPVVVVRKGVLPPGLRAAVGGGALGGKAPLPEAVARWVDTAVGARTSGRPAEWSEDEATVSLKRPGGDAWVSVDRRTGAVEYERTSRGWIALLNDLHKGRNAGPAWGWFIDAFAVSCLAFALTGLALLVLHARQRPITWPLVAMGLAVPLVVLLVFLHL